MKGSLVSLAKRVFGKAALFALVACGAGFTPVSLVDSVRILATSASEPFPKPGDTVTLTTLAVDGRVAPATPMTLSWIPLSCVDPRGDAYYACFLQLAQGGGDAGAGAGGGAGVLKPGVDLTPFLPTGPTFSVTVPADVITNHAPTPGAAAPYGTVFAFNIACAGHVEILPIDPSNVNPQAPPIGCFDANHNLLGADDYVIGFTLLYSYASISNANPVIDGVTWKGQPVDLTAGITLPVCTSGASCDPQYLDVNVPASSWEVNPGDVENGVDHHEVLWVDYYATAGALGSTAKLLYDAVAGKLSDTREQYTAPKAAGDQTMWLVVHDNRGGSAWVTIPLHVQ